MTLRNQYGEELELSSLLVYLDMRRQDNEAEVLNPHIALQSGRCLAGMTFIPNLKMRSRICSSGMLFGLIHKALKNLV